MIKMECDICKKQSENANDFCRVSIKRYRHFQDIDYGRMEEKDLCYECCQKYFGFDVKAPISDNSDIADLELSIRAYNCLKRAGYNTVGSIKNMTPEEGMKVRNLGRKSYEEVMARVKELKEQSK